MNAHEYCPPCAPCPCECLEDAPSCSVCSVPFGSVAELENGATCWTCNDTTCEECIDAYGWPCAHFTERND